jgi:glycosyltransferase involved in cell wall biosynthesis
MKVCILYDGDYPWDVRIEKMTATLAANGYQVHLVCRNLSKQPAYEFSNNIHIHRLAPFNNNFVNQWCSFPAFFNPVWLGQLRRVIKTYSIGVIIVRDLPLALAAIMVGRSQNLPVILDMAENYPAMLRDIWKYEEFKLVNFFVRNPIAAKAIELLALKTATHVMVVIEESQNRLMKLGLAESSISIVRNTPVLSSRNRERRSATSRKDASNPVGCLNLIYVGGLEPMRGLEALIQNVPDLIEQLPQLRLTIVGGGKWQGQLQAEVDQLGVSRYVTLTGQVPYSEALKRVGQSDAGIIPHRITPHTTSTIPNKLFEYMANGIPVVATDMAPVKRIIEDTNCGYVYSNVSELVTALKNLSDDNNRERLGNNALEASRGRYNWAVDGANLLKTIRSAMRRRSPRDLVADSVSR